MRKNLKNLIHPTAAALPGCWSFDGCCIEHFLVDAEVNVILDLAPDVALTHRVRQVGVLAVEKKRIRFDDGSNVKMLVLTHISGRYPNEEILAEATKTFPNSRIAADFDRIVV